MRGGLPVELEITERHFCHAPTSRWAVTRRGTRCCQPKPNSKSMASPKAESSPPARRKRPGPDLADRRRVIVWAGPTQFCQGEKWRPQIKRLKPCFAEVIDCEKSCAASIYLVATMINLQNLTHKTQAAGDFNGSSDKNLRASWDHSRTPGSATPVLRSSLLRRMERTGAPNFKLRHYTRPLRRLGKNFP